MNLTLNFSTMSKNKLGLKRFVVMIRLMPKYVPIIRMVSPDPQKIGLKQNRTPSLLRFVLVKNECTIAA